MSSNRNKIQDIKITANMLLNRQYIKVKDPSWLDHYGNFSNVDYKLLIGGTIEEIVNISRCSIQELESHLIHLKNEHGLKISNKNGQYKIDNQNNIIDQVVEISSKKGLHLAEKENLKIGKLVKLFLTKIINHIENVDTSELNHLKDMHFSKSTFNINYPFIKEVSEISADEEVRYWKKNYIISNREYRFCSQWYASSQDYFLNYLISKNIITKEEKKLYTPYQDTREEKLEKLLEDNRKRQEKLLEENLYLKKNREEHIETIKNLKNAEQKKVAGLANFDVDLKKEAQSMSSHYETFYCLERTIRKIIEDAMRESYGNEWWAKKVDPDIQEIVRNNMKWESDTVFSKRSSKEIDYTTFGQLRQIVKYNWAIFSKHFRSLKAFNRLMTDLNQLRVPIAHCTPFNKKEVKRLDLTLDDWFELLIE